MTDRNEKLAKWFEEQAEFADDGDEYECEVCGAETDEELCGRCLESVAAALRGDVERDKALERVATWIGSIADDVALDVRQRLAGTITATLFADAEGSLTESCEMEYEEVKEAVTGELDDLQHWLEESVRAFVANENPALASAPFIKEAGE